MSPLMSIRASERTSERTNERTSEWAHALTRLLWNLRGRTIASCDCLQCFFFSFFFGERQIFGIQIIDSVLNVSSVSRYCLKCCRWRRVKWLCRCRHYSDRLLLIFIVLATAALKLSNKSAANQYAYHTHTHKRETRWKWHMSKRKKQFPMQESFGVSLLNYRLLRAFFLSSLSLFLILASI